MKNQDIIFGTRPVLESIKSGKTIERIFIQKNVVKETIQEIKLLASKYKLNISLVPKEKLNRITRKNHQGIICYISPISYQPINEIIQRSYENGKDPIVLILDRVTDIRNFGSITRVAESAKVDAIIIPEKGRALITSDSIKTSAGALNYVPICKVKSLKNTIKSLKDSGLNIVSCSDKATKNIYSVNFTSPTAIILGSEKDGISENLLELSNNQVKIPMFGKIDSLNVSTSASIILYELIRQRLF